MWMGPLQTKHMTYSMFPGSAWMRQVSTDFLQKHFCIAATLWKQHRIEALLPRPNVCFMFCLDTLDRDNDFHESEISSFQLHTITELHIILFPLFCSTNDTRQILLTVETHGKKESCFPRLFFSSSVVVCNSHWAHTFCKWCNICRDRLHFNGTLLFSRKSGKKKKKNRHLRRRKQTEQQKTGWEREAYNPYPRWSEGKK